MRTKRIVAAALVAGGCWALVVAAAPPPEVGRTDLLRRDLSVARHEVVQVRVDFPPGTAFGRHTHPGAEIAYVIEGTLEYEMDGKVVTLEAGEVLFIPAGTIHAARNAGESHGAELATYIVPKGKPLVALVK